MNAALVRPDALGSRAPRAPAPGSLTSRRWSRLAPWVAPLITASLLAACTYLMFASYGASLI